MNYFLILVSVLAFTCNGFGTRLFQTRFEKAERRLPLYQALFCLISTFCFWGAGSFAPPTLETAVYGIIFGVMFCLATAMGAKGYATGSMALTSVIINMSLIVPILYSVIFLQEKLTLLHIIGFILFCVSVVCSAITKGENKKANLLWIIVVLVGFCANGSTATIQKMYVMNSSVNQDSVFLAVAYATATLCFVGKYFIASKKEKKDADGAKVSFSYIAKFVGVALLAGVGSFGGNLLLGRLATQVNAAVLYPCINGGLAICTTLVSFIIFREKPTIQKILSILVGCAAIVVLNY